MTTEQRLTDAALDRQLARFDEGEIALALRELKAQRRANLLPMPWMSMSALPLTGWHLVTTRDAAVRSAYFDGLSNRWHDGETIHAYPIDAVIAWMPFPPPAPVTSAPNPLATRTRSPKNSLERTAIAWALAERIVDAHAGNLTRIEEEVGAFLAGSQARAVELEQDLAGAKASFHLADQHATKCEGEFRQAARELLAAVEGRDPSALT